MPAAEMISGTIIGEISMAMMTERKGMWDCDSPMAATVPSTVASRVAAGAMLIELRNATCQSGLVKKSR